MKTSTLLLLLFLTLAITSCMKEEDPGPLQYDQRVYQIMDFDRIDVGDAFVINIIQGQGFSVRSEGDRRNLDDLQIVKSGSTLKIQFSDSRQRDHTTYISITAPTLLGASLSGSSNTVITGFKDVSTIDLVLSGASVCQLNSTGDKMSVILSGSSQAILSGAMNSVTAKVSGSSHLQAYDMMTSVVDVDGSGSSSLMVFASQTLKATASGSSTIFYRGNPVVTTSVSGSSTVRQN